MRAARFDVSVDLLAEALHLPASARIVDARMGPHSVTLTVSDPGLPEADDAHRANPSVTRRDPVFDWGLRCRS